ncbi:MAG: polyprenyl synthetase family protein [Clostridiaceae bacterium]|mgnify:CR=1 FL=1|jgi:geranylgeranyl diphosphate synthase type II|nr:polyprenyl synthetase family protein [Clostridiaceae bacterium]
MSFIAGYKEYQNIVENWLDSVIINHSSFRTSIHEAMEYSLMAGGKRIRPILSIAVNDMLKGDRSSVTPYAIAIELIHTYSLIHDDLPCMDNDDLRRGKPTNHKVFGEAMAVLAGDGLLNLAYEIMLADAVKDKNNRLQKSETARLIAEAAGISGMIAGQVMDMEAENRDISYEELCIMHKKKTGALIRAAVLAPAVLLDAKEEIRTNLEVYADNIGLAFQIKDDILDNEGSREIVGKSVGSDEKNNKATFVSKLGIEKAKELLKSSVEKAVEALKTIENNDFLIKMAVFIAQRNK